MQSIRNRNWDSAPQETANFEMLTRFKNLCSMECKKSILGIVFNTNMSDTQTTNPPPIYIFRCYARKSPDDNFVELGDFSLSYDANTNPQGDREIKLTFPPFIVENIQLKITGATRGGFGINDIGIIFRTHRDTSETTLEGN